MTATSWLVYRLTGSATLLGVVGFASQVPSLFVTPFAGILVDRWNRHHLLIATQTASMLQSFALAAFTLTGTITMPILIVLCVVQALVNAFDMPTRQSFVVSLVEDKRDLGNAIALNSSMFNAARLVGPTLAGAIIAVSNEGWCFFIDGVSFLAVIGSLIAMRITWAPAHSRSDISPLAQLKEGWDYAYSHPAIRSVITVVGITCLLGVPYSVLMPVFAATVLHGGADTLGFLMGATGGGALLGALYLAGRRSTSGLTQLIGKSTGIFGVGLVAFAYSRVLWLSLAFLVVASWGFMVLVASSNTLLQTIVEDSKRGRVMSFFLMAFFGTAPIGSLTAGWMSDRVGAPPTVAVCGLLCVAAGVWFWRSVSSIDVALAPSFATGPGVTAHHP
jgi:MFS family permease